MKRTSFGLALLILIAGVGAAAAQTMSYAEAISQIATVCQKRHCQVLQRRPAGPASARVLRRQCGQDVAAMPADHQRGLCIDHAARDGAARYRRRLQRGYLDIVRHVICRCQSRDMHGRPGATSNEPALLPDLRRYRLGYGKGAAMKLHHTLAVAALLCARHCHRRSGATIDHSSQMATSLANVSGNNRLAMTGAQMRQAVLDYIRDIPARCRRGR